MGLTVKAVFFDLGATLVVSDPIGWNEGAKAALVALRALDVRVGIISNTGDMTRDQLLPMLPADFDFSRFDADLVLLSSEVGVAKPLPGIFELAVTRAGVPAEQCLYCSEDFRESLAAQGSGMCVARLEPPPNSDLKDLVSRLTELGAFR